MEVYIGIDWSESKHDIVIMNEAGAAIVRQTIAHTPEGFLELETSYQSLCLSPDVCLFGLETAHNLLIDFLWSRGHANVYVIPPSVVNGTRGRYGQSGARTDQSAAFLLADLLRTDRARLQIWRPDSLLTRQMRAKVSLINHLTRSVVRLSNRLRAVLLRYYPAALHVFSSIRTQIALEFMRTYPTPESAMALTLDDFKVFAHRHGYTQPQRLPECFARLKTRRPQAMPETALVFRDEAVLLATHLLHTVRSKNVALRELPGLFKQHPDHFIFDALPGAGKFLAPALLVKFGDDRQRFSSPDGVQALAGTCPVTDSSANAGSSSSAARVIESFATLPRNGPLPPSQSLSGQRSIGNKPVRTATQTVMPIAVWPIGGWQLPGSCGRRVKSTTKHIICNSVLCIASRVTKDQLNLISA